MEQINETAKTRKTASYFVAQKPIELKTKKEVEEFLNKSGGVPQDFCILKGMPVSAEKVNSFRLV